MATARRPSMSGRYSSRWSAAWLLRAGNGGTRGNEAVRANTSPHPHAGLGTSIARNDSPHPASEWVDGSGPGVDEHATTTACRRWIWRGSLCVGGGDVAVRLLCAGDLLFVGADFAGE